MSSGINPIAMGILTGSVTGAAMGFMTTGTPMGAVVGAGIGATMGGIQGSETQKKDLAIRKAGNDQYAAGVANQNALMNQEYQKKLQARGIGDMSGGSAPAGGIASQSGAALTTPTGSTTNILG